VDIKKIDILAAGIIITIFTLAFFAFFRESRAKEASLNENKNMLSEQLRSTGDIDLKLEKITEEINDIQKDLDNFDRLLPGREQIYSFLDDIDSLARQNNVRLRDIRPGTIEKGDLYAQIPVNISGNAGFKEFYGFLYQLENIPRITRLDRLKVGKSPEEKTCDIEMTLTVFIGGKAGHD